jgi:hypothetical protein
LTGDVAVDPNVDLDLDLDFDPDLDLDLDLDLDPTWRCWTRTSGRAATSKVDDRVNVYVAVEVKARVKVDG